MAFVFIPAESLRPHGFTLVVRTAVDVNSMLASLTGLANQVDVVLQRKTGALHRGERPAARERIEVPRALDGRDDRANDSRRLGASFARDARNELPAIEHAQPRNTCLADFTLIVVEDLDLWRACQMAVASSFHERPCDSATPGCVT